MTRDVTERSAREEMMRRLAFYDPLTGLANRRLLQQRLKETLEQAPQQPLALVFIDLDHFKPINDTFGHETGDLLLKLVAERMGSASEKKIWWHALGGRIRHHAARYGCLGPRGRRQAAPLPASPLPA